MTTKYDNISGTVEKEICDTIEDIMWGVNDAARKKGVKHPRCNVSKVLRMVLKYGLTDKDKIKKELIDDEVKQWKEKDEKSE